MTAWWLTLKNGWFIDMYLPVLSRSISSRHQVRGSRGLVVVTLEGAASHLVVRDLPLLTVISGPLVIINYYFIPSCLCFYTAFPRSSPTCVIGSRPKSWQKTLEFTRHFAPEADSNECERVQRCEIRCVQDVVDASSQSVARDCEKWTDGGFQPEHCSWWSSHSETWFISHC